MGCVEITRRYEVRGELTSPLAILKTGIEKPLAFQHQFPTFGRFQHTPRRLRAKFASTPEVLKIKDFQHFFDPEHSAAPHLLFAYPTASVLVYTTVSPCERTVCDNFLQARGRHYDLTRRRCEKPLKPIRFRVSATKFLAFYLRVWLIRW